MCSKRNYRNLISALDHFGRIEVFMELWRENNRRKLGSFLDEVTRRFHNFPAGTKTLMDRTRVFKNLHQPLHILHMSAF